jgi:hypothetical protein
VSDIVSLLTTTSSLTIFHLATRARQHASFADMRQAQCYGKAPISIILPVAPMSIQILGTGSFAPSTVVTNEELCEFLGAYPKAWAPELLLARTGIRERRYLFPLGCERNGSGSPDTDLAFEASKRAVQSREVLGTEIGTLIYVTCTPDLLHFSATAAELHRRLELSPKCFPEPPSIGV